MQSSFDMIFDRSDNQTMKWDAERQRAGNPDLLCFGTADMDFQSPYPVRRAVRQTADIGHFGYPLVDNAYYSAIEQWLTRIAGWKIDARKCVSNNVGIYTSIWCLIDALTDPGDEIIIQQPVHFCFEQMIRLNGRAAVVNPLICKNNRYEMDFEQLESCFTNKTKVFWLCNPHNPVGRAWTAEELKQLANICIRHGVRVISDDVYCGMTFGDKQYTPISMISPEISQNTVICYSTSKIYNTTGLKHSFIVSENPALVEAYNRSLSKLDLDYGQNMIGIAVTKAALNECDVWVRDLMRYIEANYTYVSEFVSEKMPDLSVAVSDATYFAWLDCTALEMTAEERKSFFEKDAQVLIGLGEGLGTGGAGHIRMNLGCRKAVLEEGMNRIYQAYLSYKQKI